MHGGPQTRAHTVHTIILHSARSGLQKAKMPEMKTVACMASHESSMQHHSPRWIECTPMARCKQPSPSTTQRSDHAAQQRVSAQAIRTSCLHCRAARGHAPSALCQTSPKSSPSVRATRTGPRPDWAHGGAKPLLGSARRYTAIVSLSNRCALFSCLRARGKPSILGVGQACHDALLCD